MSKRLLSASIALIMILLLICGCAPNGEEANDINVEVEEGMGTYIDNDIKFEYTSIFEETGVETLIRDSIIGGERSSLFNDGWKFFKTSDFTANYALETDLSKWTDISLPHDFQVIQTGNIGSRGTMTKDYAGWYKKSFSLSEDLRGKRISLRFDGIYQDSTVYLNGEKLAEYNIYDPEASDYSGSHYYGYKSFEVDLSDKLLFGDEGENVITVVARDRHSSSRWYTGGGINRSVWLTVSDKVHVEFLGTYVYYDLNKKYSKAKTSVETEIKNDSDAEKTVVVSSSLYNNGELVDVKISDKKVSVPKGKCVEVTQEFTLSDPKLWGLSWDESGNLYTVKTEILSSDRSEVLDTYLTEYGYRDIQWNVEDGIYLNGEHIKIQGVCQHENLGSLGSANEAAAIERQVVILKEMGVNSIRTAHNICTPELISICNRYGMLVFEEAYDAWDDTKDGEYSLGGQGIFFESYESDIKMMVRRDRSAPCVFIWSIGNEINSTVWGKEEKVKPTVEKMIDFIYEEDHSGDRFVTLAQIQWSTDFSRELSKYICDYVKENYGDYGVMGQNYRDQYMKEVQELYPDYRYLGTEQSSALRSRGVYHEGSYVYAHDDLQLSSLDNSGPAYFLSAESMYMYDMNRDWYAGQYIWTGFDYIGESTPYYTKNSYFGAVDTAGLPKDVFYFYRSAWNKDADTVHILPYWDKNDGDKVQVVVYSNAEKVELIYEPFEGSGYQPLTLSQVIDWKDTFKTDEEYDEQWISTNEPNYNDNLKFVFELDYHPGTIYAVATYADGHKAHTSLSTPDDAYELKLDVQRETIAADGQDMSFIEVTAVDKNGNTVALCSDRISVEVSGAGDFVSIDTGNSVDYDSYQSVTRRLFNGKAVIYVRSNGSVGDITVNVSSVNMPTKSATVSTVEVPDESTEYVLNASYEPRNTFIDTSLPLGETTFARKLEITLAEGQTNVLTEENPTTVFNYRLLPESDSLAKGTFKFAIVGTESYVIANNAKLVVDEEAQTLTVTGLKPGTFRVYGTYTNGYPQPQLLSSYTVINESAVSNDPALVNSAYDGILASKLDSSSRNASYAIDYKEGVIKNLNRPDDSLVYKDVEFGDDTTKELILTCLNTSTGSNAVLEVYVDDTLFTEITIPHSEANNYSYDKLFDHVFEFKGVTGTHDITFLNRESRPTLHIGMIRFTGVKSNPISAFDKIEAERYDHYSAADHLPRVITYRDSAGNNYDALKIQDNTAAYYTGIDFGETGASTFEICMKMRDDSSRIAVKIGDGSEQYFDWTSMDCYVEGEYVVYSVTLDKKYSGVNEVMLMAYPGSGTYIDWFRFVE